MSFFYISGLAGSRFMICMYLHSSEIHNTKDHKSSKHRNSPDKMFHQMYTLEAKKMAEKQLTEARTMAQDKCSLQ